MAARARLTLIGAAGLAFLAAGLLFANTAASESTDERFYFADRDPELSRYGFVWPSHVWTFAEVYVCWENPDQSNEHGRKIVEQAIAETWVKATNGHLTFKGWRSCQSGTLPVPIVRIRIADEIPNSLIGNKLNGVRNGVTLNMTFHDVWAADCAARVDDCIRTASIHEFGHVLGLLHENLRPHTATRCDASGTASQDNSYFPEDEASTMQTPYDPDSIMNYCNKIYARHAQLSEGDRKVAALLYESQGF